MVGILLFRRFLVTNFNCTMKYAPLIGRILFSAIFIMFGISHFTMTQDMLGAVPAFLPAPTMIVYLTGLIVTLGGIGVLLGFKTRESALALAFFLLGTAFLTHFGGFADGDPASSANFMKDLSLAGAALMLSHFGAGPMSLDAKNSGE